MKKAERKELDKFVKEKIDLLHDTNGLDYTPSDMAEKKQRLVECYSDSLKKQERSTKTDNKSRKRKFFVGFATGTASLVIVVTLILVSVLKTNNEFYYNDDDLTSNRYTLTEFIENFDILLPDMADIKNQTISVYRDDARSVDVYAKFILINSVNEEIELVIIFVDNYIFKNEQQYNSLTQTHQTSFFSYSYYIIEEIEVSYAKFTYNGCRYYLKLSSETPSNIIPIVESFN